MKNELREEQARRRPGPSAAAPTRRRASGDRLRRSTRKEGNGRGAAAALDKLKEEAATALAATEAGHATLAEAAEAELDS